MIIDQIDHETDPVQVVPTSLRRNQLYIEVRNVINSDINESPPSHQYQMFTVQYQYLLQTKGEKIICLSNVL